MNRGVQEVKTEVLPVPQTTTFRPLPRPSLGSGPVSYYAPQSATQSAPPLPAPQSATQSAPPLPVTKPAQPVSAPPLSVTKPPQPVPAQRVSAQPTQVQTAQKPVPNIDNAVSTKANVNPIPNWSVFLFFVFFVLSIIIPILFLIHPETDEKKDNKEIENYKILAIFCIISSFVICINPLIDRYSPIAIPSLIFLFLLIANLLITTIVALKIHSFDNSDIIYNVYLGLLYIPSAVYYCLIIYIILLESYKNSYY